MDGSTTDRLPGGRYGPQDIPRLAQHLRAGGIVGIPTETVYGLAADATDQKACLGIFAAKGRPADNPLIVHCATAEQAITFASDDCDPSILDIATEVFARFAPGPLSVVLPASARIAPAARAGQPTVALRIPAHSVARALLQQVGLPLAAPSANRSGQPSPTDAAAVLRAYGTGIPVLDGGPCDVGIESTVVEIRHDHLVLYRPGFVTRADLSAALGLPVLDPGSRSPRSPGRLHPHYQPKGPCWVLSPAELERIAPALADPGAAGILAGLRVYGCNRDLEVVRELLPSDAIRGESDAAALARNLFRVLTEQGEAPLLLVAPHDDRWGEALADRMGRAASGQGAIDLARRLPFVGTDQDPQGIRIRPVAEAGNPGPHELPGPG